MSDDFGLRYRVQVVSMEASTQYGVCLKLEDRGCYPPYVSISGLPPSLLPMFKPDQEWELVLTPAAARAPHGDTAPK